MFFKTFNKRNQYFIQKAFQIRIIARFILIIIIGGIISGLGLYYFAANELETKLFTAHMLIKNTRDILLPIILLTSITVSLLLSFITIYTVLYLTHRIAGPLYKFEKITEEIGKGNFNVYVKLREKDELIPLQIAFENMIENLQIKIVNFKNNFEKTKKIETMLIEAIYTSTLSEIDKSMLSKAVKELTEEYENYINAFTIKDT